MRNETSVTYPDSYGENPELDPLALNSVKALPNCQM